MRLITLFILTFSMYCVQGQTLSLDDIFNIRTMDSTTLRTFSHDKGFELKEVEINVWRSVHKYYSSENSIWFDRNFPTGKRFFSGDTTTIDSRMVGYHFTDKETRNEFKEKMKEKGFKFRTTNTKDWGGNIFTHNIYLNKDKQIDLVSEKLRGQKEKYTLMYYRKINK